jgi:riboflavin kinase/FMN adenylyltransferase
MRVVEGLDFRPLVSGPTAVAAGNFDGLHLGHQKILRFLVERASQEGLLSVVLTFSPHPERVLGRKKIEMIQTVDQRLEGLRGYGVEAVLMAPFNRTFAGLSVADFVGHVLVRTLGARAIVVGENFRFGRNRGGDIRSLRRWGERAEFEVYPIAAVVRGGRVVSSSLIRRLLKAGRVDRAAEYLGRPYEITGTIVAGVARGRSLGFPTANLRADNEILPQGVFVTRTLVGAKEFPSVTNIGNRPTFGCGPVHVETFLFGFSGSLYRRRVRLRFLRRLRAERAFASRGALVAQIRRDIQAAERFFEARRGLTFSESSGMFEELAARDVDRRRRAREMDRGRKN